MANDRQQPIVFDYTKIPSDQTGMPILITRANYDDEVVDPSGSNAARTDGGDRRLYKNDDQTGRFALEVVSFEHDSSTGAGDAVCVEWIQDGSFVLSSTADTTIYSEYGDGALSQPAVTDTYGRNPVWSDLKSILHLVESGDGTSGEYIDSTGNGLTGQGGGGTAGQIPSQVSTNHPWGDNWQEFDGSNDWINVENSGSALDSSDGYVSAWIRVVSESSSADEGIVSNRWSAQGNNYFQYSDRTSGMKSLLHDGSGENNASDGTSLGTTTTQMIAMSWSGSSIRAYYDGALGPTDTTIAGDGQFNTTLDVRIGTYFDGSSTRSINARIGEVWIQLAQPTDDRVTTLFNNQSAPGTFASAGTPVSIGGPPTGNPWNYYAQQQAA